MKAEINDKVSHLYKRVKALSFCITIDNKILERKIKK
jgi:hypothetical protein